MKYWEEFQTKWGFSDGDAIPPDARACREVYVREINRLAAEKGSVVRLLAYDRPGVHNCYLIASVPAELVTSIPPERLCIGQWEGGWAPADENWKEPPADEAMETAIQEAFDMDLDGHVETEVRVRPRRRTYKEGVDMRIRRVGGRREPVQAPLDVDAGREQNAGGWGLDPIRDACERLVEIFAKRFGKKKDGESLDDIQAKVEDNITVLTMKAEKTDRKKQRSKT